MDDKKLLRAFGLRIQQLRKRKGWSQEELAEAIGRSRDAVSNIERGVNATPLKTAYLLANTLGVSLSELFDIAPTNAVDRERRRQLDRFVSLLQQADIKTLQRVQKIVELALDLSPQRRTKSARR